MLSLPASRLNRGQYELTLRGVFSSGTIGPRLLLLQHSKELIRMHLAVRVLNKRAGRWSGSLASASVKSSLLRGWHHRHGFCFAAIGGLLTLACDFVAALNI